MIAVALKTQAMFNLMLLPFNAKVTGGLPTLPRYGLPSPGLRCRKEFRDWDLVLRDSELVPAEALPKAPDLFLSGRNEQHTKKPQTQAQQ